MYLLCAFLLIAFVSSSFVGSILRYAADFGALKLEDFTGYSFASLVIFSVLVAFYQNVHVRVDMISNLHRFFDKRIIRIVSALPFMFVAYLSLPAVLFSWSVFEGSPEPSGLGGVFIIKTLLPISLILISLFLCFGRNDSKK